jgi:hypothetical protein
VKRLSKRWETFRSIANGSLYRAFLSEGPPNTGMCWGCIEFKDPKGPFRLEIWNNSEYVQEWEYIRDFPTLKEAKAVGRLLAGVALAKNF